MADDLESREKAMKAVQAIFDHFEQVATTTTYQGFDAHLMKHVTLLSATSYPKSTTDVSFHITEQYGNMNGVMHGGAAGLIFDMCTTIALGPRSGKGFWEFLGGVTRSLNISYLKAVPIGTTIRIHAEVMQIGRTMALIRGTMSSLDGSIVYATCDHHKVSVPTREEKQQLKM